jgi:hypothetical protein
MRAMDEPTLKVFISYRTKDHAQLVPRIAKVLRAEGIEVVYDETLLDERHRQINSMIPISSGVNFRLFMELLRCHVALVLISDEPADPYAFVTRWQDWVDLLTQALADISIRGGQGVPLELQSGVLFDLPMIWYLVFYDIDIRKQMTESWQEWEVRISGEMGLALHPVRIPHDVLLEDYFRNSVVPCLIGLPRRRQRPRVKPEYAQLYFRLFIARRLAESAVATVTSPYRRARNAVTYVRTRLRAQVNERGKR